MTTTEAIRTAILDAYWKNPANTAAMVGAAVMAAGAVDVPLDAKLDVERVVTRHLKADKPSFDTMAREVAEVLGVRREQEVSVDELCLLHINAARANHEVGPLASVMQASATELLCACRRLAKENRVLSVFPPTRDDGGLVEEMASIMTAFDEAMRNGETGARIESQKCRDLKAAQQEGFESPRPLRSPASGGDAMRAILLFLAGLVLGVWWQSEAFEAGYKGGMYAHHILNRWALVRTPKTPVPDLDYRGGEWLDGFCARTRIDEWASQDDWKKGFGELDGIVPYYDLSIDYPDRTVKINCERNTIDIHSKADGPEGGE